MCEPWVCFPALRKRREKEKKKRKRKTETYKKRIVRFSWEIYAGALVPLGFPPGGGQSRFAKGKPRAGVRAMSSGNQKGVQE